MDASQLLPGLVLLALFGMAVFGALGTWVAEQKGRPLGEGAILGLLLGPYGVLIEAPLPSRI